MPTTTTIRIDKGLKNQAQEKLEALGLNFNTFVIMATKQLVAQNRIPFDLEVPEIIPRKTQEALDRSLSWANNPIDPEEKSFRSVDYLFEALDAETANV